MVNGADSVVGKTADDLAFERINADRLSASEYYRTASQYLILINGVTTSAVIAYLTTNIKEISKIGGFLFLFLSLSVFLYMASVIVAGIFTYLRMQAYDQWANWWEMKFDRASAQSAKDQFDNAVRKSNTSDSLFLSSIALFVLGTLLFIGSVAYQTHHRAPASDDHEIDIIIRY